MNADDATPTARQTDWKAASQEFCIAFNGNIWMLDHASRSPSATSGQQCACHSTRSSPFMVEAVPHFLARGIPCGDCRVCNHEWQGKLWLHLFVAGPIVAGMLCSGLMNLSANARASDYVIAGTLACVQTGVGLLLFKLEGMTCLAMAAALIWALVMLGMLIAWIVRKIIKSRAGRRNLLLASILSLPLCSAIEARYGNPLEVTMQTTSIEIDAPPSEVWKFVPAFPDITAQPGMIFRAGIAFPIRSEISGAGIGAARRCVLSTGTMDEIVTAWEPNHRLDFDVLKVPPAMTETSIYDHLETPHLRGYFVPQHGRFELVSLPGGRTRLVGTSWYVNQIWPKWYWGVITESIVHQIHERVLAHIKVLSEQSARAEIKI